MGAPLRVLADTTGDWSEEACRTVAYELTSSLDLGEHRNALVDTMVWIHMVAADLGERVRAWTGRQYHPSPQHLLSLLHSFSEIVREQHEQHEDQQRFRLMDRTSLKCCFLILLTAACASSNDGSASESSCRTDARC